MILPPFEHFNYEILEDPISICKCILCLNYRKALQLISDTEIFTKQHEFRCRCDSCKTHKAAERILLIASNKRDTYSELSWISAPFSWKQRFLTWVWMRITDTNWKNNYYWAHEAERKPLCNWFEDWLEDDPDSKLMSSSRLLEGQPIEYN